jgi:hypothetical protein
MPARDEMDDKRGHRRCSLCRCGSTHPQPSSSIANNTNTTGSGACNWMVLLRSLFLMCLVAFFVWSVMAWADIKTQFRACLTWVDQLGMFYGSLVLCCANIIGAILFLPCLPFTLASGILPSSLFMSLFIAVVIVIVSDYVMSHT